IRPAGQAPNRRVRSAQTLGLKVGTEHHFAAVVEAASATVSADATVVSNFAWQHMRAASIFVGHALQVEQRYGEALYGTALEELRSYVSGAVMSAAASHEALKNEFYLAPSTGLRGRIANFEAEFWAKGGIERKPILVKYQHALELLGLPRIPEDDESLIQADALVGLRNSLVHFKPLWDSERPNAQDLRQRLNGAFNLSRWATPDDDFVAKQCMSADCARWAVASALAFMWAFNERAHLDNDKMAGFRSIEA
ncbi:hypothetical protein, partial [Piscinibacter defluvii]|uniref:hypothetical protein n=1 Tax=Piscinibacter defluvii TaxID=1796922 RepID=UPI00197B9BFA